MSTEIRKVRKDAKRRSKQLRKDRLIQTRVDARLQKVLLEEARRRRMSVSNLVRGVLEDAFGLADPDLGPLIEGAPTIATANPALDHIYAWNPVVLGKDAACVRCNASIARGERGLIGLSEDPSDERAWLCADCGDSL